MPDSLAGIGVLLAAHGIQMARTRTPLELEVEAFRVDSVYTAAREYQGHMQTSLAGAYEVVRRGIPAGTLVVPMNQPLARLVFALLEPTATDGVVNWNFLDSELVPGQHVPIVRVETLPIDLD